MRYLELIRLQLEHKVFATSVIANLPAPVELIIKQVDDHVKMRLISQLINETSTVLQKSQLFQNLQLFYYFFYILKDYLILFEIRLYN